MNQPRVHLQALLSRGHSIDDVARACVVLPGLFERLLAGEELDAQPQIARLLQVLAHADDGALQSLLALPEPAWAPEVDSEVAWGAFLRCVGTLRAQGFAFALGGARALALHGVSRETHDVDVFFAESARRALQTFRDEGFFVTYFAADHFVIRPHGSTRRDDVIDAHFPVVEPARSAIDRAVDFTIDGVVVPVLPVAALVASKLMASTAEQNEDAFLALDADAVRPSEVKRVLDRVSRLPRITDPFRRNLDDIDGALERLELWKSLRSGR